MTDSRSRIEMLAGRDYTVREDGAWIFTREYLLTRGTCCGSKCINCPYEFSREKRDSSRMRPVISMVPSWTETLIHARANVVGRTRFCIHPAAAIEGIPSFGGTKNLANDSDARMKQVLHEAGDRVPLVVLDREENPKEYFDFFAQYPCEILVTHVSDLASFRTGLGDLRAAFAGGHGASLQDRVVEGLLSMENRAKHVGDRLKQPAAVSQGFSTACLQASIPPHELQRLLLATDTPIFYFIWKNPWMIVRADTWIGETFRVRFSKARFPLEKSRFPMGGSDSKYSEIEEAQIPKGAILFFSSEPYPFEKFWDTLRELPFVKSASAVALLDGECFSWFGIRALRFWES